MIKLKLKRREDNDPVLIEAANFSRVRKEFFIAACKALNLDRFVDWLNSKLK